MKDHHTVITNERHSRVTSELLGHGVRLDVEQVGDGPAMILVHGSWSDQHTWAPVFNALGRSFHVLRYDRRGYGKSERAPVARDSHVNDLLALIETRQLENVILVGNSLGGLIAIHAALRTSRVRLVIAHEPAPPGLLEHESGHHPAAARARVALGRCLDAARTGDYPLAAQTYVEGMAAYPGAWAHLPSHLQQAFIATAEAFLADATALGEVTLDPGEVAKLHGKLVMTRGGRTSPYLKLIMDRLSAALPHVKVHVFPTGGHVPHQSCPEEFVTQIVQLAQLQ